MLTNINCPKCKIEIISDKAIIDYIDENTKTIIPNVGSSHINKNDNKIFCSNCDSFLKIENNKAFLLSEKEIENLGLDIVLEVFKYKVKSQNRNKIIKNKIKFLKEKYKEIILDWKKVREKQKTLHSLIHIIKLDSKLALTAVELMYAEMALESKNEKSKILNLGLVSLQEFSNEIILNSSSLFQVVSKQLKQMEKGASYETLKLTEASSTILYILNKIKENITVKNLIEDYPEETHEPSTIISSLEYLKKLKIIVKSNDFIVLTNKGKEILKETNGDLEKIQSKLLTLS